MVVYVTMIKGNFLLLIYRNILRILNTFDYLNNNANCYFHLTFSFPVCPNILLDNSLFHHLSDSHSHAVVNKTAFGFG